jgi:BirA family biotin operon repressor/biotin-[acetyl-CoA-carboxylase] ligase
MAIFAHEQTAGRGQMGRKWEAETGANIALSIVIKPEGLRLSGQFQLSACAAISVHELLAKYAGDETKIKWPNDLYWQDRKAGGVLIESVVGSGKWEAGSGGKENKESAFAETLANKWKWAIIGIGININQTAFPDWLPNPVSLKQITGQTFDPVLLAKELCGIFQKNINELLNEGFEKIYAAYLTNLYKKNSEVKFKKENRVFEATVKSVSPSGKLIVQHSIEEELDFGELEWIISK